MASGNVDLSEIRLVFTELWVNPNPTSSFSSQKLQIDLTDYDGILMFYMGYTNSGLQSMFMIKQYLYYLYSVTPGSTTKRTRSINPYDSGIQINTGYSGTSSNNSACVPYKIYGFKYIS